MNQLGIFAKFWEPGKVKTRLAQSIGPLAASEVYLAFLTTLVERFTDYPVERRVMAYWPSGREAEFQGVARAPWQLEAQVPGDLGQRMAAYFQSAFAQGAQRVILIGSDCPLLGKETLDAAFAALREHSVVLGPTEDGGYYLIGGRSEMPDIFTGVPWSTPGVWSATTARLDQADCRWQQLAVHRDIDDLHDLQRLARQLDDDVAFHGSPLHDAVNRALKGEGMRMSLTETHQLTIRLDQFLQLCGVIETGGQAKRAIQEGAVLVNGIVETRRRRKLREGDEISFGTETFLVQLDPVEQDGEGA